jgi:biopolymer transport protein ExbD
MNRAAEKAGRTLRVPQRDLALQVVPLIDIMFLLLLFFMLGADMSQRECPELALPRADVPLEKLAPDARSLTANVRHDSGPAVCVLHEQGGQCRDPQHWRRTVLGRDLAPAEFERELCAAAQDAPEPAALHLLVRADERAPYGAVQQLFQSAARSGVRCVELAAARKP